MKNTDIEASLTVVDRQGDLGEQHPDHQCFNNGGNHPKAGNKETVTTSLTTTGTFPVRNGQTTGSLSVGPPSQGDFSCPSGQSLFLQTVTYSGITVSDATGNSLGATPDPISGPTHIPIG
jgi:hypothetical protein